MTLPPLPEPSPYVPVYRPLWAEDRMREYGALCYRQALEEAAKEINHITIGPYSIFPYPHGGYWIGNESGEGAQIFEANMLAWIEKLWKEEF